MIEFINRLIKFTGYELCMIDPFRLPDAPVAAYIKNIEKVRKDLNITRQRAKILCDSYNDYIFRNNRKFYSYNLYEYLVCKYYFSSEDTKNYLAYIEKNYTFKNPKDYKEVWSRYSEGGYRKDYIPVTESI